LSEWPHTVIVTDDNITTLSFLDAGEGDVPSSFAAMEVAGEPDYRNVLDFIAA
jgi:hypothetical protein